MLQRVLSIVLIAALGVSRTQSADVSGVVFDDTNRNGAQDAGEPGIAGVAVSNQDAVVTTDAKGAFRLTGAGTGVVFVSTPDGYRAVGPFWRAADGSRPLAFALTLDGEHLTGRAQVKQTDFKLKPYSALFGTLKVADVVEVTIDATLPKGSADG